MRRFHCVLILCVVCAALTIGWSGKSARSKKAIVPTAEVAKTTDERKSLAKSKSPPPRVPNAIASAQSY